MSYSRDEVAAELLSFYQFLTRLHLPADALKIPPAGEGWPNIDSNRLSHLNKNETVIDLLKHIPYIRRDDDFPRLHVYENSICNDFSGKFLNETEFQDADSSEPLPPAYPDDREKRRRQPHMATLASPNGRDGWFIFCDTKNGEMELADLQVGTSRIFHNAKTFFDSLKEEYRALDAFPMDPEDVCLASMMSNPPLVEKIRTVFHKYGWPNNFQQKEQCFSELQDLR